VAGTGLTKRERVRQDDITAFAVQPPKHRLSFTPISRCYIKHVVFGGVE